MENNDLFWLFDFPNNTNANESVIFSQADFYHNYNEWVTGKINVLFVTGFLNSGIEETVNDLKNQYNAVTFDLSNLRNNVDNSGVKLLDKVKKQSKRYAQAVNSRWVLGISNEYEDRLYSENELLTMGAGSLLLIARADTKNQYILYGPEVVDLYNSTQIKHEALIIKGTSALKSVNNTRDIAGDSILNLGYSDRQNKRLRACDTYKLSSLKAQIIK